MSQATVQIYSSSSITTDTMIHVMEKHVNSPMSGTSQTQFETTATV